MRRQKNSNFVIIFVGLMFIVFVIVYTGSANSINKWIQSNSELPSTSSKSDSSTNQPNSDSHIIPASQVDSYLKNINDSENKQEFDYSLMHATENDYEISINNIQIKSFNYLNPDYVDYSSLRPSQDVYEINLQPKYIQKPLTLCEFKIENTCNKYIYPFLNRATIVYENGTQVETLCGNPFGFDNYEYDQISQYIMVPNIQSLAPGAICNFTLVFNNLDMSDNPVMILAISSRSGVDTIRIPLTNN